ncbi:MAG: glycogen/starch synthase, partial [Dehalococcoidia bacterium]|nr:glycogen/starch synthase [Dehalococcoidia bacterium]
MVQPLKILFCAAEVSPLAKVGGLADVVGSLPKALAKLGHDVRITMPHYSLIDEKTHPTTTVGRTFTIATKKQPEQVTIQSTALNGNLPVYLINNKTYFARPAVYGEADDLERFIFFSNAAIALPQKIGWQPDVIHCHDWHTAVTVLNAHRLKTPSATVFTVHNLAYQGAFDDSFLASSGLQEDFESSKKLFPSLSLNMMALGILHSDMITTVSQNYAQEILTPEYGAGMESLLYFRKDQLQGIVNGIDYSEFDPATDPLIAANYDSSR